MDSNLFSSKQIEYMYSDSGFLSFINRYFSSFLTCSQDIDYDLNHNAWNKEDFEIYMRIILANIEALRQSLSEVEQQLTSSYIVKERDYAGEIHGKLEVNKYIKQIAQKQMPRSYPCLVKERTAIAPENVYVIYIIDYVTRLLLSFQRYLRKKYDTNTLIREQVLIDEHIKAFRAFSQKGYFVECLPEALYIRSIYGEMFPQTLYNTIVNRIRKGKIRNAKAYKAVFDWFRQFRKGEIVFVGEHKINILRYSDDFANKLFELWCLYSIKETFVTEFGATIIDENDIMTSSDSYVFKLSAMTGGFLEIYYQKGASLYWKEDAELSWRYKKEEAEKPLRGIPDISIRYSSVHDSLVMVDIKNRIRVAGQNSEEIYKMIGYFDNFRYTFENVFSREVKKQGALLFRNDNVAFNEYLVSKTDYRLLALSVSPSENYALNRRQFKMLCKYVFDLQGIDGLTSEILGSYSKSINDTSIKNESAEDKVYRIRQENHQTISQMFSYGDLAKELPRHTEWLRQNHLPHIWQDLSSNTIQILSMAECLFSGTTASELADYAPICLEYCRALEVQLNELIFTPFKQANNIQRLLSRNRFYDSLTSNRELTLGECIFLLDKCNHRYYPTLELKRFIASQVKQSSALLSDGVTIMRSVNEEVRRKSAHTSIMVYEELVRTRQMILGIGNKNIFYFLLDKR